MKAGSIQIQPTARRGEGCKLENGRVQVPLAGALTRQCLRSCTKRNRHWRPKAAASGTPLVPAIFRKKVYCGTSTLASDDMRSRQSPKRIQAALNAACLMPLATPDLLFRFSPTFVTGSSDAMKQL